MAVWSVLYDIGSFCRLTVRSETLDFYSSHATFLMLPRGVHDINVYIYDRLTTDQRPTDLTFWKISNDHTSATGRLIRFVFGFRVGFLRSADRMALFPVGPNPRSRLSAVLDNFEWLYPWNGSSDPIRIWF